MYSSAVFTGGRPLCTQISHTLCLKKATLIQHITTSTQSTDFGNFGRGVAEGVCYQLVIC